MPAWRALAVLLAFTLVPLSPTPMPSLDRPSWTAGDHWTYSTNTTLTAGLNLTGTVTSTVQGLQPTTVGGASVDAYQVLLSGTGSAAGNVTYSGSVFFVQGTWIVTGEERFEPVELQPVYSLFDLTVDGKYQGVLPYSVRVQNTTTFEILADGWPYPHLAASSGVVTVRYNFTQDSSVYGPTDQSRHDQGTGEWTETFSMAMPVDTATPLRTFRAFPITATWPDGSRQLSLASPEVGNDVRTESYAPGGNLTAVTVLTSYRYQALETPTYLGLTAVQWAIVAPVVAAAAVGLVAYRRRRRQKGPPPPEGLTPGDLTSGPRGP